MKSMAQCKTAVTPVLTDWSYCSLALSYRDYQLTKESDYELEKDTSYLALVGELRIVFCE